MPYYYGYGFGIDPLYLLVVLVCTVLGLAAQNYINSTYKTWSKVRSDGDTGATVARRMLDANGCSAVGIKGVAGELTDHYNPQDNNLYLSDANRSGGSVASVAVACHEAGHAAQRQSGYAMMKVRTALVPVVNFTQNTWTIVLLLGLFMNIAGLTSLALIFFSFSVLFQLVTLPVEIDGHKYVDGGVADSVPIEHVLEEAGFDRAVVIVTQDRSYEKKPYEFMPAARARYADYPYLLEAIETRHDRYNIQRMHLWKYEREGRALVVAPQKPVEVGHVEHDPAKLLDLYIQGRQEAKRLLSDIEAFVER